MLTKQWLQVEVDNEIVMHFLLSFISNLDFKPLFLPIEGNLEVPIVQYMHDCTILQEGGREGGRREGGSTNRICSTYFH